MTEAIFFLLTLILILCRCDSGASTLHQSRSGAWLSAPSESEREGTGHKIVISDIMLIDGLIADKDKRLSIQHLATLAQRQRPACIILRVMDDVMQQNDVPLT